LRGQTRKALLGLADLDTRHKHESESVGCEAHHLRNPNDGARPWSKGKPTG
jgi:hypothetical protein